MLKPPKLSPGDRLAAVSLSWGGPGTFPHRSWGDRAQSGRLAVLRRALRSYAAMGILKRLSGILLGRPGGPVPVADFSGYEEALLQVVVREEGLTDLTLVTRMDFGHTDPMFVLPLGVRARIDCEARRFAIVENAVAL